MSECVWLAWWDEMIPLGAEHALDAAASANASSELVEYWRGLTVRPKFYNQAAPIKARTWNEDFNLMAGWLKAHKVLVA